MTTPVPFEHSHPDAAATLAERGGRFHCHLPLALERNESCSCGSGKKAKRCCLLAKEPFDWTLWSLRILSIDGVSVDIHAHNSNPKELATAIAKYL